MLRALGLLVLALASASVSEARSALDAQLRANHVYHLTKFVEWPTSTFSSDDAPLRLCVVAPAGNPELEALAGRVARGRKIEVVSASKASALRGCQVLVFDEEVPLGALNTVARDGVLTVGEGVGFARAGGIVGLVPEPGGIGFAVNRESAKGAGLRVSSRLLRLAEIVDGPAEPAP